MKKEEKKKEMDKASASYAGDCGSNSSGGAPVN